MNNSQLVQLLTTFSKKEIRDCRKWLESVYHNQRQDVIDLYEYCFAHFFDAQMLIKETAFKAIFPNEPFDDAKIRQTMYFLRKSVEAFLLYNELKQDEAYNEVVLAGIYRERKLFKLAKKQAELAEKALSNLTQIDYKHYLNEYLLENEKYGITVSTEDRQERNQQLQKTIASLDRFYITDQLRNVCSLLLNLHQSNFADISPFIETIIKDVEEKDYSAYPVVTLYYTLFKVLQSNDNDSFDKLKKDLLTHKSLFSFRERREIILMVINYCIVQMNRGDFKFIQEAFDLYRLGLEENVLMHEGYLPASTFRNILSTGLRLKEFEWVKAFIEQNSPLLHPSNQESFTNFGLGSLYFTIKDYNKAREYLGMYEHDDLLLNLNTRAMLLKMYYELDEFKVLDSLLESFKVYLRRKKGISEGYVALYSNLIKFTKKLALVNPYSKAKKEKLRQEILQAKPMINKEWFLEQLDKLG